MTTETTKQVGWHIFYPIDSGAQCSIGEWLPGGKISTGSRNRIAAVYPITDRVHLGQQHCLEAEANAHLIAAAPALLAACRGLLSCRSRGDDVLPGQCCPHISAAEAAIALAEGGADQQSHKETL